MFDGDSAAVIDGGPDRDGLTGDVTTTIQSNPTRHRSGGVTGQADLVLNLAMKWLLQKKASMACPLKTLYNTHCQNGWLEIEINRIHDDEDLLIFMGQTPFLSEGSFAKVLHPAMFAQECGWKAQW